MNFFKELFSKKENNILKKYTENVFCINDIDYSGLNRKYNFLDVFYPQNVKADSKLPIFIYIHGGELSKGDKADFADFCSAIACQGNVVFNINYRLEPKFEYPAQIVDVIKACKFAYDNAEDLFADNKRIFIGGNNSGAFLASVAATIFSNENICRSCSITSPIPSENIIGLALFNGYYDGDNGILPKKFISSAEKKNVYNIRDIIPLGNITEKFPTSFICFNENNFRHKQSFLLLEELMKNGIGYNKNIFFEKKSRLSTYSLLPYDEIQAENQLNALFDFIKKISNDNN
ncbi:MAG: alpha/beta hydrolase [Clostridiales bacterium]|nr:alpha/beta hydrolase [Clostridiales bacterium]